MTHQQPIRASTSALALALLAGVLASCHSPSPKPNAPSSTTPTAPTRHAIHNLHRLNDRILTGAQPESDAAFEELKALGVTTIISVDGSSPDVAAAASQGLRYVHIPTTYATVTDEQRLEIARAIRDLPGPVFIHCHHGKHRGPAAAAAAAIALGMITNAEGTAFIKDAGTAPAYTGLFECVADAPVATKAELDAAPAEFPNARKAHGTTAAMVEIDLAWDHLGEIKAAGWKTPKDNPDLVPAAEAGRLTDNFRIALEDKDYIAKGQGMPADYVQRLATAVADASTLEESIIHNAKAKALDAAYARVQSRCTDCHAVYRNKVRSSR